MESGKERKVCFIASSGGHWEELMCLKSVAQKYDAFYVTEEGGQANDASANLLINHKVIFDYLFKSSYMPV